MNFILPPKAEILRKFIIFAAMNRRDLHIAALAAALPILISFFSCARIGTPSGGPVDEEPPRFMGSVPEPFATGFDGERIEILFDELVSVKDAFTNVTLSPPQRSLPKVSSSGRKVIVTFNDTLMPATTYVINFGKSIEDVNEGNRFPDFFYSFSTGAEIDTLQISGIVLDAMTLEPQQGVLVGANTQTEDSVFRTKPFERVTKTDDRGRFVLRGLKPVPYRVFALGDLNSDYRRDNPAELTAFLPFTVTPFTDRTVANDTIYNMLTGEVDTVLQRERTRFLPNDLLLQMFDTGYRQQYVVNSERQDSTLLRVIFNDRQPSAPALRLLSPSADGIPEHWYLAERNERNDTLSYWLTPQLWRADTIRASVEYEHAEYGKAPETVTDTLTFVTKRPRKIKAPKRTARQLREDSIRAEEARFIKPLTPGLNQQEVWRPLSLEFPEPLVTLDTAAIHLEQMIDSVWNPCAVVIGSDSLMPRRFRLETAWEYGGDYRLRVDSLAAQGLSGRFSKPIVQTFKTKKREDYASLVLRIRPDTVAGFVEVLNTSDNPVQRAVAENGVARFDFLAPADYYVRFVADTNGNGRFDPGDYDRGLQPEDTYYYPRMLSLRRYDRNEEWDLNATPVDMQKPEELKKNKPEATRQARKRKDKKAVDTVAGEEDDYFDVNRNPFDPNDKGRRRTQGSY